MVSGFHESVDPDDRDPPENEKTKRVTHFRGNMGCDSSTSDAPLCPSYARARSHGKDPPRGPHFDSKMSHILFERGDPFAYVESEYPLTDDKVSEDEVSVMYVQRGTAHDHPRSNDQRVVGH
jgi:hypothetical protein